MSSLQEIVVPCEDLHSAAASRHLLEITSQLNVKLSGYEQLLMENKHMKSVCSELQAKCDLLEVTIDNQCRTNSELEEFGKLKVDYAHLSTIIETKVTQLEADFRVLIQQTSSNFVKQDCLIKCLRSTQYNKMVPIDVDNLIDPLIKLHMQIQQQLLVISLVRGSTFANCLESQKKFTDPFLNNLNQ